MQVTITSELEQIIQTYLDSGKYQNPTEVLLAGLELLQREDVEPITSFGVINQQNQFLPLTESEMVQESLKVLKNYQHNGTSQSKVENWANNLGRNQE
jgi:Arc/MetJ-type ribon-helix-helix transcriptional regulator